MQQFHLRGGPNLKLISYLQKHRKLIRTSFILCASVLHKQNPKDISDYTILSLSPLSPLKSQQSQLAKNETASPRNAISLPLFGE